ncbi:MAG: copper chaperone [Chitinophagaceae bacterium]|nr:copper chaperone [Chitinophagaceae bacterium]
MKKTIKSTGLLIAAFCFALFANAQSSEISDSVMVNGNCGSCKKNIEKSAMNAGATFAMWNKQTKMLNLKFDPAKTNRQKIENQIAAKGYDTENAKASDDAYYKLEECCQYDRKDLKTKKL